MRHVAFRVADQGLDERPVLRVVEIRSRPARGGAIPAERNEVRREELLALPAPHEEPDVRVAPALVRAVAIEVAAAGARQVADRQDGLRELPPDGPPGALDHRDQRLETPPYVARRVTRHHPQVGRLVEVHPAEQLARRGRAHAPPEPQRRGSHDGRARRHRVPRAGGRVGERSRANGERGDDRREGERSGAHGGTCPTDTTPETKWPNSSRRPARAEAHRRRDARSEAAWAILCAPWPQTASFPRDFQ